MTQTPINKLEIADTKGREPIGVVLSCGIKGDRGFPTEKEYYHLVVPREDNGKRPHHSAYASFNTAPGDKRKIIRGNIVHSSINQCFEGYLKNQVGPKPIGTHPDRRPFCTGDGVHAVRWSGDGADDFLDIKCPHERCEYRLTTPPTCKPFIRLLFQLRWQDGIKLPRMLCKFNSGSWNTYLNIKGFFDHIDSAAKQLSLAQYNLFGFPFSLSLTQQTKPSQKTRFPVTVITPEMDVIEFFGRQMQQIEQIQNYKFEAINDQSQQTPALQYEDVKSLNKGWLNENEQS